MRYGIAESPDYSSTPSKVGFEIQIDSKYTGKWVTGSIYGLAWFPDGSAVAGEWNRINFESRHDAIRVYVNGVVDSGQPNKSDAVLDSSHSPYYDDAPHSSRVQPRFRIRPQVGLLQGFTCARCFRHQNRESARPQ